MNKSQMDLSQFQKQTAKKAQNIIQEVKTIKIPQNLCQDTLIILNKNQLKLAQSNQSQKQIEYSSIGEKAEQFADYIDNKISNLMQANRKKIGTYLQFHNLFQPNTCAMCIEFLPKDQLESYVRYGNHQTPVFLISYEGFLSEQIQNHICALANEGSGAILIVNSHPNNEIKQGFFQFSPCMLNLIQQKIRLSLNQILNNNIININVDFVKLFQDLQDIGYRQQVRNQFAIRIKVSLNQDEIIQNFCVKFMKTKNICRHKMFKAKLIQNCGQIYWDLIEIQSSYQQMVAHARSKILTPKTNHNCKQINNFQLIRIKGQNKTIQQFIQPINIKIEIRAQKYPFDFLYDVCKSIQNCCIQNQFQQIKPSQSILIFLESEKQQKNYLFTPLTELLKKMRCKYQVIEPMIQLQKQVKRVMKIRCPQFISYNIKYIIYNSNFTKLQNSLPELYEKYHKLSQKMNIRNISERIRAKAVLKQKQIEKFIQIIKKKFNIQLNVQRNSHIYQNWNQRFYKDLWFHFQKHQIHIAACVCCLLYLANKMPVT